jgi:hypothetical protein
MGKSSFVIAPGQVSVSGGNRIVAASFINSRSGSFNGTSSYVDLGATAYAIQRTQAFTINVWVKPSGTNGYIFTNRNPSNSFIGIGFGIKTNGHLFANLCGASTTMQVDSLGPVQGIYSMVTWTNDGSSTAAGQKLYINAVLQTNTVDADNLSQTILGGGNACLGASSAPGTLYTGLMDEWSYKASVLSQAQITALFNQGRPGTVTADHLYRFENSGVSPVDSSSTIYDRAGSADGTNHNVTFSTDVPPSTTSTAVAQLDGAASYADLGSGNLAYEYTNAFSINVWVRPQFTPHEGTTDHEALQAILGNYYQPTGEPSAILGWQFGLIDDGNAVGATNTLTPYLELAAGGDQLGGAGDYRIYKFGAYSDFLNTWTMATVTYSGNGLLSDIKCFLNGVESTPPAQAFDNLQNKTIISPVNVVLGCLANYTGTRNHFFKGYMTNLTVWTGALPTASISALYSDGRHGDPTANPSAGLLAHRYPLNGLLDSILTIKDQKGSADATNHGITFVTDPG